MTNSSVANPEVLVEGKDPRTIITPHAFSVAESLLYTPLASPLKRAIAICIDGLLISVLAEDAGVIFVALVLLTSFLDKRLKGFGRWAKIALYTLMTVVMLYTISENFTATEADTDSPIGGQDAVTLVPAVIALSLCDSLDCANTRAEALTDKLASSELAREDAQAMLQEPIDALELKKENKAELLERLLPRLQHLPDKASLETEPAAKTDVAQLKEPHKASTEALRKDEVKGPGDTSGQADTEASYSLIEWVKGILNDLGLGFGWAAFYFTVFTAWFDGQTLGKKLMGIRVISLDGSKLGLWGAFGRYGGYGAGFATGLLGFMQVFWDANRQAIQDKISATVVIDLTKPRQIPQSAAAEGVEPNE